MVVLVGIADDEKLEGRLHFQFVIKSGKTNLLTNSSVSKGVN